MPYPALVGDPALILPLFYQPKNKEKKYKLGIIPHVIDLEHPIIKQIQSENSNEVLIINLSKFEFRIGCPGLFKINKFFANIQFII